MFLQLHFPRPVPQFHFTSTTSAMPESTIDLDSTYGAMFIGLLFACFFQGVLSLQVYHYYECYPNDSGWMKRFVALIWALDMVHLYLISHATYYYLVSNWGNPSALGNATLELDLHMLFIGLATILCQLFFLQRVWVFSNRNIYLMIFLVLGCLTTLVLDITMTAMLAIDREMNKANTFSQGVVAVFSIGAGIDVIIAILMCFYLARSMSDNERTNAVLSRIIQYTVGTGLLTSLVAVACLATYLLQPASFFSIAIHFSLGRMYTNALLATLNSRKKLKDSITHDTLPPVFADALISRSQEGSGTTLSSIEHKYVANDV
ncbi:hypothetical protein BDQ12DRAFT_712103 [Crucibulum laeve]|uniref:DUF6534 domain-containing protein n=1 Tax=Crucibulum laeve TaxID=68775 RepID=A0A5C3M3M7_9AGAR|nr:hypothetical protein BDQ12DRAFT_712103 [Crucibulum laeve]